MVAIMDPNLDSSRMYHFVAVDGDNSVWRRDQMSSIDHGVEVDSAHQDTVIVRSVAMSANVANIVKDEVRHFIKVSDFDGGVPKKSRVEKSNEIENEFDVLLALGKEHNMGTISGSQSSCSHILPTVEGSVIFAIILSRWDDIMGPQTVHAWLQENSNSKDECNSNALHISLNSCGSSSDNRNGACVACHYPYSEQNTHLMKAMKYVTSHTVNCTGLSFSTSVMSLYERESNLFVVPDLGLVAQSLVFHVQLLDVNIPFSLAVLVGYQHYDYFLHLRRLCHQWLCRMAARLQDPLIRCMTNGTGFASVCMARLNNWILELWHTVFSLGTCGLGNSVLACGADILTHPLLERALTSHLQTFGCSVVMGTSSSDINTFISFLALFLDSDERFCSRLVLPSMRYSYHMGLFIQGLLLDEFGCRELCSVDLAANPYLATAVDLTKGINPNAVRQTPPHLFHRNASDGNEKTLLHRSILYPVKDSASLVKVLLRDMRHLAPSYWQDFINLFLKKINSLAYMLLSFIHHMSAEVSEAGCQSVQKYLMKSMNLPEGDFLVVLAAAEKLKPGIYAHIMELDVSIR